MQPNRPPRGPGSFSPLPPPSPSISASSAATIAASTANSAASPTFDQPSRPPPSPPTRQRHDSLASSDDSTLSAVPSPLSINKVRQPLHYHPSQQHQNANAVGASATTPTSTYPSFTTSAISTSGTATPPSSTHNNFSRPTPLSAAAATAATARQIAAAAAAASVLGSGGSNPGSGPNSSAGALGLSAAGGGDTLRAVSPLTLPTSNSNSRQDNGPVSPLTAFKPASGHSRKHSQTAGLFDATLPSTNGGGSLSQVIKAQQQQSQQQPSRSVTNTPPPPQSQTPRELSTSQIAAQTAVLHHQLSSQVSSKLTPQQQQQLQQAQQSQLLQQQSQQQLHQQYSQQAPPTQQHQQQHSRQRSQTVPTPGDSYDAFSLSNKRSSGGGPLAPPILSLTEASAPRENGFGNQTYHNGLLGSHASAAQTAASVVFSRSGASPASPKLSAPHSPKQQQQQQQQASQAQLQPSLPPLPPPPPPPPLPEKKAEKTKVKLFSRPGKISTKGEAKEKPLPSPNKMGIGSALASLQRGNFSTTSLDSNATSFYSLGNSSAATIRAADSPSGLGLGGGTGGGSGASGIGGAPSVFEKEVIKEKEKKHHFLSRQKHKLKDKDDFHLPLSSASSNSRPTDPNAPSSLYNFSLPPSSPGPNSTTFKSMSGLDLRHGGRALREKKKEDKAAAAAAAAAAAGGPDSDLVGSIVGGSEWPGPSSLGSAGIGGAAGGATAAAALLLHEPADAAKYGFSNLSYDDAWPYLKAKLQVIFEGEDLRIPVEHLNRVVIMHIQYCIQRRSPNIILEDLRELLTMGFASLDRTLRKTPEDRLIPALVELWLFTFTSILPYMQAVFLPLDLEFSGTGTLLTPEQARDFWGGVPGASSSSYSSSYASSGRPGTSSGAAPNVAPVSAVLDVRRLVLAAYRDTVILPRYDTLKPIFSRLSLEFLPQSLASMARASPMPIPIQQRPGRSNSSLVAQQAHSFGSYSGVGGSFLQQQQLLLSTSPGGESAGRPGTAMSLDPSTAGSFNSSATTLTAGGGGGDGSSSAGGESRSRAISNVSFGSGSEPRPSFSSNHTAGSSTILHVSSGSLGSLREHQNVEDSKQVTEMVGRMLQCMSVLASVVGVAGDATGGDEGNKMVEELCRLLKLNWLGRGRTGRNRRGMVGGRVRRGGAGPGGAGDAGATTATREGLSVA